MRFRFRIGPFTFGRSGTRLSIWNRGTGISVPLSKKKGRTFGKVRVGPISGYFGSPFSNSATKRNSHVKSEIMQHGNDDDEVRAIEVFGSDQYLLNKLQNNGVPWRGIQERLKDSLPEHLMNRDGIAYRLVPRAMTTIFGQQNSAWKTEKRPSKGREGETTWIVLIN